MKIAIDPAPYLDLPLGELPDRIARNGYQHLHLAHPGILPAYRYPKIDRGTIATFSKALADAGVSLPATLVVQRISWPDEEIRKDAVRNFERTIQVAVDLGITQINTEFSGLPEQSERSEAAFYRSIEDLLPTIRREGVQLNFDAHPYDFVEDGLEAWRIVQALDDEAFGFVYVAAHTFHYGDRAATLLPEVGDRLRAVYAADVFDHRRSGGLRYVTNPPGNATRVHQHSRIGLGDVDWTELFTVLQTTGYLTRPEALIVSNVFGEAENADETAIHQRHEIDRLLREAAAA
ncbi:sugar phosphate isomerase/epimerase family protein [Kineococcus rhizosphaerae]|uniref:Myo-inositol catabolism protein IolH n=1 Tax=Kineococcus rhizosphaerae TaxID=559628 RepID=A0A2T0QKV4_9ACTN|nr:sugar phosphate isomerase/epimerase [Kineococcus rhizosphaerae]PRY04981.1 myo-inositol catabolism protein IolH [Kineococcus rhizosphaerae]